MDHIPRLSEVLYVGLCRKLGTPREIAIRRDVLDMEEMIMKPFYIHGGVIEMINNTLKHHIIFMEDCETPPGFVRLRLLTPNYAQSSIIKNLVERCQRYAWPSLPVLEKIIRNRCHCVPIGSKLDSPYNELEWRLSFSQAEQQLVCTMNHTQFLCYGLLKIFLKEVMNNRQEPILCSYYMKTTMFWIMQLGHVQWYPNNLLDCFWKCFKYLIHFVYPGEFPNFFIPQNNMFINKVVGDILESLLQELYQYYRMGVSCLPLSPTLRSILESALCSPSYVLSFTENNTDIDLCGYREIFHLLLGNRSQCLQSLTDLQTMLLNDDGTYVPLPLRDISWQILGICQHVVGDLDGALLSYQESLRQEAYHGIQEATYVRIEWVKGQLDRNT
ncbi:uncharacterized protein LOC133188283 [Saccostrea echinata]|uniref:uncharacterized protein LOC133188283 n=1 Tax=Saccostrea echinata TaxID=191078 RepID=UPI002A7F9F97|nr:uncharacterized protein LOC133188283 [Saccostrea echinata]